MRPKSLTGNRPPSQFAGGSALGGFSGAQQTENAGQKRRSGAAGPLFTEGVGCAIVNKIRIRANH